MDICGNASPILIEKDAQIRSGKCGSPSSSSSDSDSSSSGLCCTMLTRCIIMINGFSNCCQYSSVILINVNTSLVFMAFYLFA